MKFVVLLVLLHLITIVSSSNNLAFEIIYQNSSPRVHYSLESDGSLKGPLHKLTLSIGEHRVASIEIPKFPESFIEINHTADSWVVILDPSERVEAHLVYPEVFRGVYFEPPPTTRAIRRRISLDGIFLLMVPADGPVRMNSIDWFGALGLLDGKDPKEMVVQMNRIFDHFFKYTKVVLVAGRLVPSPRPPPVFIDLTAVDDDEQKETKPIIGPPSLLKQLYEKSPFPYILAPTTTWNLERVESTGLGSRTNALAFLSRSGNSGASIYVGGGDSSLKLVYERSGKAKIIIYRPGLGIVTSDATCAAKSHAKIKDEPVGNGSFRIGDLVAIVLPLNPSWKLTDQLTNLLHLYASKREAFSAENICATMRQMIDGSDQVFLSISTISHAKG